MQLRLKTQPKLTPPPLLTNSVQEAGNSLLLREAGAVKVLAHDERESVLADAVLADYSAERGVEVASLCVVIPVSIPISAPTPAAGCCGRGGVAVVVRGGLGAAGGEGGWGAQADALG